MMVPLEPAVGPNRTHPVCESVVAGEQRPALAVTAERLGWEEAGAGKGRDAATALTPLLGAEALSGIFYHGDVMSPRDSVDLLVVRHLAEQADRNERLGAGRKSRLEARQVQVECDWLDIDKHGPRAH